MTVSTVAEWIRSSFEIHELDKAFIGFPNIMRNLAACYVRRRYGYVLCITLQLFCAVLACGRALRVP
jgi:hypothetical protein